MFNVWLDGYLILQTDDALAATVAYEFVKTLGKAEIVIK